MGEELERRSSPKSEATPARRRATAWAEDGGASGGGAPSWRDGGRGEAGMDGGRGGGEGEEEEKDWWAMGWRSPRPKLIGSPLRLAASCCPANNHTTYRGASVHRWSCAGACSIMLQQLISPAGFQCVQLVAGAPSCLCRPLRSALLLLLGDEPEVRVRPEPFLV